MFDLPQNHPQPVQETEGSLSLNKENNCESSELTQGQRIQVRREKLMPMIVYLQKIILVYIQGVANCKLSSLKNRSRSKQNLKFGFETNQ